MSLLSAALVRNSARRFRLWLLMMSSSSSLSSSVLDDKEDEDEVCPSPLISQLNSVAEVPNSSVISFGCEKVGNEDGRDDGIRDGTPDGATLGCEEGTPLG